MRVAALYDIHANLPALEAVLREVQEAGVDLIVVGGDVLLGPWPQETLARLLDLDLPVRFIHGNCERAVLGERAGTDSGVSQRFRPVLDWTAEQLSPEIAAALAGWPSTVTVEVEGLGAVLFCHATPRNDTEIFTRLTPEANLLPVFAGVNAAVVVCGHTHMQFDRMVGGVRVVNAGSVGSPFGAPGAHWLVLGPSVELRYTDYDRAGAAEQVRATAYPGMDRAVSNLAQPLTEDEALAMYTPVEIK